MMKIGLLSLHKNANYGWVLQCYALLSILKSLGHDVTYIDKVDFVEKKKKVIIKSQIKTFLRLILGKKKVNSNINPFFLKYITPRTSEIRSIKGLDKLQHFDAVIVGSDQVWRPLYVHPIENYYLDFVKNSACKKISYAASFGTDKAEYSASEIQICGNLLKLFHAVSIRESSAIGLIRDVYRWQTVPLVHVLDPTLLLCQADYDKLIGDSDSVAFNGNLFCYLLDMTSEKGSIVRKLESDLQKKAYSIQLNTSTMPSVENWLKAFKDADFVFTDSYHGCIFSIIFRKPFIVMGNRSRGLARFTSLLEMFGLMDLMIESSQELTSTRIDRCLSIDWIEVEECIAKYQNISIMFLKTALDNC